MSLLTFCYLSLTLLGDASATAFDFHVPRGPAQASPTFVGSPPIRLIYSVVLRFRHGKQETCDLIFLTR